MGYAKWEDLFEYPKIDCIKDLPARGTLVGSKRKDEGLLWDFLKMNFLKSFEDGQLDSKMKKRSRAFISSPGAEGEITVLDTHEPLILQTIYNVKPSNISDREFYLKKNAFYKKLVPVRYIRYHVDRIVKSKFRKKVVGVHVRTTDLLAHCWDSVSPSYLKYAIKMRDELKKDPTTVFYLSADTRQAYQFFYRQFKGKIIFYEGHIFYDNGEIVRDTVRSQRDALIDVFLLAKTSKIIGTKFSSFSTEAACIGNVPLTFVYHK